MNIGKRIAKTLIDLGMERKDLLARVPDLSAQALSNLIRRDSKRSEWDEVIAEALGVSVLWLVYGKHAPEKTMAAYEDAPKKTTSIAQEPASDSIRPFPDRRRDDHPAIAHVVKLMLETSDDGKLVMLGRAQEVAAQWPKANQEKLSQ